MRTGISFCTTCMGRRVHLEQTLPNNLIVLEEHWPRVELVVLDYASDDGLGDWIRASCGPHLESGLLRYARTDEPSEFHMSHAKNVAHRLGRREILFNLDADNFVGAGTFERVDAIFGAGNPCIVGSVSGSDMRGRLALRREDFARLGGYDERMRGWGREDVDLVQRAKMSGLEWVPVEGGACLPHDDATRTAHAPAVDISVTPELLRSLPAPARALAARIERRDPRLMASYVHNVLVGRERSRAGLFQAQEPGQYGRATLVDHLGATIDLGE